MRELQVFVGFPPEPVRRAWCAWLEHHGIDPDDVACPGWIERDEECRRIRYESYAVEADGKRLRLNEYRTEVLREVRTRQLEARPSPFPVVAA